MHIEQLHAGRALALVGVAALFGGFALPQQHVAAEPAGNNGTVKVDEVAFDGGPGEGPGHDNDPHLAECSGQVEWYGFDTGDLPATVTFTVWPPTADTAPEAERELVLETVVHDGDGPGVPNDAAALDGVLEFDLTELLEPFTPQENQGFHVKIVVETPNSQGSDVKHKVFWVEGCDEVVTTTTTSTTTTSTTTTSTTAPGETTTTGATSTTAVQGTGVTQATSTTLPTEVAGVQLVRTGLSETLLALGFGLLVLGLVLELVHRAVRGRRAA